MNPMNELLEHAKLSYVSILMDSFFSMPEAVFTSTSILFLVTIQNFCCSSTICISFSQLNDANCKLSTVKFKAAAKEKIDARV